MTISLSFRRQPVDTIRKVFLTRNARLADKDETAISR